MLHRTILALALFALPGIAAAQNRPPLPAPVRPAAVPEKLPFAAEIAAFEAQDALAMPRKGGVLFLGSSSIRMWKDLTQDFPRMNVINRGFGGSTIPDSVRYVDRIVTPYAPRTIVFYAGDNDLEAGHTPEEVLRDFQALVTKVRARLPGTRILFIAIKPSLSRWKLIDGIRETNALVRDYVASAPNLGFIDIFPAMLGADGKPRPELFREDGLHMTRAGYDIWRREVAYALHHPAKAIPAPPPPTEAPAPAPEPGVSDPAPSSPAGR